MIRNSYYKTLKAFTDYPIVELGDKVGELAPIRECTILEFDRNKYCLIEVEGVKTHIKSGYLYKRAGRCGEAPIFPYSRLCKVPKFSGD